MDYKNNLIYLSKNNASIVLHTIYQSVIEDFIQLLPMYTMDSVLFDCSRIASESRFIAEASKLTGKPMLESLKNCCRAEVSS